MTKDLNIVVSQDLYEPLMLHLHMVIFYQERKAYYMDDEDNDEDNDEEAVITSESK